MPRRRDKCTFQIWTKVRDVKWRQWVYGVPTPPSRPVCPLSPPPPPPPSPQRLRQSMLVKPKRRFSFAPCSCRPRHFGIRCIFTHPPWVATSLFLILPHHSAPPPPTLHPPTPHSWLVKCRSLSRTNSRPFFSFFLDWLLFWLLSAASGQRGVSMHFKDTLKWNEKCQPPMNDLARHLGDWYFSLCAFIALVGRVQKTKVEWLTSWMSGSWNWSHPSEFEYKSPPDWSEVIQGYSKNQSNWREPGTSNQEPPWTLLIKRFDSMYLVRLANLQLKEL